MIVGSGKVFFVASFIDHVWAAKMILPLFCLVRSPDPVWLQQQIKCVRAQQGAIERRLLQKCTHLNHHNTTSWNLYGQKAADDWRHAESRRVFERTREGSAAGLLRMLASSLIAQLIHGEHRIQKDLSLLQIAFSHMVITICSFFLLSLQINGGEGAMSEQVSSSGDQSGAASGGNDNPSHQRIAEQVRKEPWWRGPGKRAGFRTLL